MLRAVILGVVLTVSSAGLARAATFDIQPAVPTVLAQYSSQNDDGSERRTSSRSNRGMVKLVVFGVVGAIAVGGWVLRKMRGE